MISKYKEAEHMHGVQMQNATAGRVTLTCEKWTA